jgi:aspartyl-tRNA synthetase
VRSPIAKFFSQEELTAIKSTTDAVDGDMIFFGAGTYELVSKVLNKVRLHCRDQYELVDNDQLAFAWITDFPLYEYDESREQRDF